jgi:hypothetical protein
MMLFTKYIAKLARARAREGAVPPPVTSLRELPLPRPAPERDEAGRFVSAHRLAVRAKCRKMLTDMGKEIPEVLR